MKKLFAMLLTLALLLSMAACSNENGGDPDKDSDKEQQDDGLVTVYMLSSVTHYLADGSRGYRQLTYTYNDRGLLLSTTTDRGLDREEFEEETGVYVIIYAPFDEQPDYTIEYTYNDHGDLLYTTTTNNTYDTETGELTETKTSHEGKDNNYTYHYDEDGKISSVDVYLPRLEGGHEEEIYSIMHCVYDDKGQLVEVYTEIQETGKINWAYDYRYDEAGRLTGSSRRPMEGVYYYQYEYNADGLLTAMKLMSAPCQTPIDDQHVSEATEAYRMGEFSRQGGTVFEYDDSGRLIARGDTRLTYDTAGRLHTVSCGGETEYVFVDDEKDADSSATTLVRDINGNVVKIIDDSGSYLELEYRKFRLTEAEAKKCKNIWHLQNRVSPIGVDAYQYFYLAPGCGFMAYLPLVETELYELESLMCRAFLI